MKKYLFVFLILLSCKSKKEIVGERIQIFKENDKFVIESKEKIEVNGKLETYTSYYGDGSNLNVNIENFKVDFELQDKYFSNIVYVDKTLYYVDKNGKLNGKYKIADDIKFAKLSYDKDTFYLTTGKNLVVAFEKDGHVKWSKELNVIPISAPVIDGDSLYFITNNNKTFCLNAKNGQIKWIHYGNNSTSKILGVANPVVYNDYVISGYSTGDLILINRTTGQMILNIKLSYKGFFNSLFDLTDTDSTPIIKNDVLYASASSGNTIAFNLKNIKVLWEKEISTIANILVNNNTIYLLDTNNTIFALNNKNGKVIWFKKLEDKKKFKSLMFANSKIYAFNENGYQVINSMGEIEKKEKESLKLYGKTISVDEKLYGVGK
ncbi:MAG: PQQ-like beta-propeller repeat protein [Rickettsiales bacterium]|jgi:outer membrane protein assembly factor BamB|nr:PQQ-like beta-propeller repeat protein [Rickettsiales bacterium]